VDVLVPAEQLLRGEGARRASGRGTNGGGWGDKGSVRAFDLKTGREHDMPQYGVLRLDPCRIVIEASAGGGWGDPMQRDPDAVLRDVRDGIISSDTAREVYGVEISACGRAIASTAGRAAG
jgi:N-methylhydantoinase B